MLKLKDAYARVAQARKHEETLRVAFNKWASEGGIQLIGEKDPVYARYAFAMVMHKEPEENLALLAGEICNNLRTALDYLAFQIYLAGGGDPDAKQAKSVAFPVVREEDGWGKAVRANMPNAWDEAIEKVKWCQPFVQFPPNNTALPALQGVGATDKHRSLVLYAMGTLEIGGISPELKKDQGFIILMYQPGPVLEVGEPGLIGQVYIATGDGSPAEENLIPWGPGVNLEPPPGPRVVFGFRANDGSEVSIDAIPQLIAHVEQILDRFKKLKTPAPVSVDSSDHHDGDGDAQSDNTSA